MPMPWPQPRPVMVKEVCSAVSRAAAVTRRSRIALRPVRLEAPSPGMRARNCQSRGAWGDWRTAKLDASGAYRVAVTMTNAPRDWQFRACMPGDGASNLTGLSAIRDLRVTAAAAPYKVTLALSATEVAVDTTATYSGTATTAAGAPATGTVTVQKRLASGGAWGDWRT